MQQRRTPGGRGRAKPGGDRAGRATSTGDRGRGTPGGDRGRGTPGGSRRQSAGTRQPAPARSAARPAASRRVAAAGAARRTRAPQPHRITGRAAILCVLLVSLLLAYAYPVRVYLSQQAEIASLQQRQAAQQQRISSLADKRAKWNDDQYIITQARQRLHYVLPGETPLVVIDDQAGAAPGSPGAARTATAPWFDKLWSSLRAADRPAGA